jgi:murein peptide amidase A
LRRRFALPYRQGVSDYFSREAPAYTEFIRAWKRLGEKRDFAVCEVLCCDDRTLLRAEIGNSTKPLVSITAGMHGDEPAAPWALFTIVRDDLLDARFSYHIWPCVNPTGYSAGTRLNADGEDINRSFSRGGKTPEARALMAANRDRRYVLQIDMHEDPEAEGFYCYEPTAQPGGFHGPAVLEAIHGAGFPLQEMHADFELGYAVDTLRLSRGHVLYDCVESAETMSGLPLNVYLFCRRTANRVTTFESPGSFLWDERIAMHRLAVPIAIRHAANLNAKISAA